MEKKILMAALYIRVSTEKQEELSPDSQKRLLLDYAKSHDMIVSEKHIYIENGISGRKADKRPKFQQMIATAKSSEHPFDVILLWKFSRFARNQEESIVYKSMLRNKYSVDVVSISEPLVDGPFGSLIERIIEWMDEFYSIRLSGDVTRGMTQKALNGGYQCRPPLGYRIPYHKATPEIVPEEAKIVRLIFEKYVYENMSIFAIVKHLNSLGHKTSHGKPFEKRSIEYILQNPGYAGDIRWNRTINETNEIRDPSEWIIRPGHHPAIIDKELFEKAQERYHSEYKRRNGKPSEISKHWLSGLLKCSKCGRSLSSCIVHRKTLPDTFCFQCYGYLKGKCNNDCYVREEEIGPTVIKALEVAIRKGTVSYTIKKSSQNQNRGSELDVLYKNLDRLSFKEERAKEAYIDGIDTKEEYKANKLRLQKERQELQEMINTIECSNSDTISNDSRMLSSISDVLDIIKSDKFTIQEKNAALKSIVDQITYDKKTNHIDVDYYLIEAPETL
ncbi:recombinase family protein [Enterocloster clostridioformis]